MKNKKRNRNKSIIAVLAFCLLLGAVGGLRLAAAIIDETNATHIDASEIEPATMIIGTHLIYIGSLSGELYEIAVESEQQSSQYNRYYKSELADGIWFDITNASGLTDISTSGIVVSEEEIEALLMTHHTKSDGITYNLMDGKSVCIFDINNPYNFANLEELNPIKVQYDRLNEKPKSSLSDTDKRNLKLINELYTLEFSTEETKVYDRQIASLQEYYEILVRDEGDPAMTDMVLSVMEKLDAARRTIIFERLDNYTLDAFFECVTMNRSYFQGFLLGYESYLNGSIDDQEFDLLMGIEQSEETTEETTEENTPDSDEEENEAIDEKYLIKNFLADSLLTQSIGEAQRNVNTSYTECIGKMSSKGTTVLSAAEYAAIEALAEAAEKKDFASCDGFTKELIYIDNINNNRIGNAEEEIEYLVSKLIPMGDAAYMQSVSKGVGEQYKGLPSTAAAATKAVALKNQKNDTEAVRTELQFLLQAKVDRESAQNASEYLKTRLNEAADFENAVLADEYESYAMESIKAYIQWLTQKSKVISSELKNGLMDELRAEKKQLQDERQQALDHNDLQTASFLDAKIEAVDKMLEDEENRLNNIINSDSASKAEKADAAAALGEGSSSTLVQDILGQALEKLADGKYSDLPGLMEGLGALAGISPDAVLNALQQIYNDLAGKKLTDPTASNELDKLLTQVENITAEQMDYFKDDLSVSEIANLLDGFFGIENAIGGMDTGRGSGGGSGNGSGSESSGGSGSGVGSGSGAGSGNGVGSSMGNSAEDLLKNKSASDRAVIIVGLNRYIQENGSSSLEEMIRALILNEVANGNAYFYEQLHSNKMVEYVPLDLLARLSRYRYIFNDTLKQVVLQKGALYYEFQLFYQTVKCQKGTVDEMNMPAAFQNVLYIDSEYTEKTFAYHGLYLAGTDYAVLLNESQLKKAEEFFAYLMEVGG